MVIMYKFALFCTFFALAGCYPQDFQTRQFKAGIEYENSLPMTGGSDRYRHRNNLDPFIVTISVNAKSKYVISYIEVTTTTDATGDVDFNVLRGQTGARNMVFQLVSNQTEFLSFSYLAYGIKEDEYRKLANIVTIPFLNKGIATNYNIIASRNRYNYSR